MPDASTDPRFGGRPAQPLLIRLSHWINVPLLLLMAGSGLQILWAYPALGPRGAPYWWYPFQGVPPPRWATFGGWLAGARHWHFALAWFLVLNGLIYLLYLLASGEWRRRMFVWSRDAGAAVMMLAYYLRMSRQAPASDFYNGLQRLAYSGVLVLAVAEVLSGLAIYKPLQLWWLAAIFGGYDGARAVHLSILALIVCFAIVHLLLVALHPKTLVQMITGGGRG
jgi:thiosulfate reductase cytochrome b subunit